MAEQSESFGPNDLSATPSNGHIPFAKGADSLDLYAGFPSSVDYTYGGIGVWKQSTMGSGGDAITYTPFTFGLDTPASGVPRLGTASYLVNVVGQIAEPGSLPVAITGTGVFGVDFLSGVFDLQSYPIETNSSAPGVSSAGYPPPPIAASGYLSSSDSTFSGPISVEDTLDGQYMGGQLSGRFYGPSAQEVGAAFFGNNSAGDTVAGAFYGSAPSGSTINENLALTNLVLDQRLEADGSEVLQSELAASGDHFTMLDVMSAVDFVDLSTSGSFQFEAPFSNEYGETFTSADQVTSSRPNFTTYQKTVDGAPTEVDLYNVGPSNTELALTYTSFGIWSQGSTQPRAELDQIFIPYGLATDVNVLLGMTGEGHYSGVAYGSAIDGAQLTRYNLTGTSSFDVNFSSHTFSGSFDLDGAGLNGAANRNFGTFDFSGTLWGQVAQDNEGSVTQAGASVGNIIVQFNGPKADEIGAGFNLSLPSSTGATGLSGTEIGGVLVAKHN